jgi:hypothetical protein
MCRERWSRDEPRPYHTTEDGFQFKIYVLFICVIFHLILLAMANLGDTETREIEIEYKQKLLYLSCRGHSLMILP